MNDVNVIQLVEVTIKGEESPARTAEVAKVKQKAYAFGAKVKYVNEFKDKVELGFVGGENLGMLVIAINT